ncbi:MAG: nucleotidyl transferase AbiEii/AbiGii toxin family protein, partial [Verrucomicrobia bacterium]|nr:nucleotidyl transferase AbiEii/AbiGii toxin family protein [Verrucomicrobiota bacterium]
CWTLKRLFDLPDARDHFIFKGGTSLSNVWKVIHRFSEDIDISLSREWLGYAGSHDPEAVTGKERKRCLKSLAANCAEKLRTNVEAVPRTSQSSGASSGKRHMTSRKEAG